MKARHSTFFIALGLIVAYLLGVYLHQFNNIPLASTTIVPVIIVFIVICLTLGISLLTKSYKIFDKLGFYSLIEMGIKGSKQDKWKKIKFKLDGIFITTFGILLILLLASRIFKLGLLIVLGFLLFLLICFAELFVWIYILFKYRKKGKKTKEKNEWKW